MNKDGGWGQEAPLTLEREDSAMLPLSVLGQPLMRGWLTTRRGLSWSYRPTRTMRDWARLVPGASFPCPRTYLASHHLVL